MKLTNLARYLPKYYRRSRVIKEIFGAFEAELDDLDIKVKTTQNELFVNNAEEHLALHEQDVGVELQGGDILTRRGRVLSKLRGTGTATKAHIRNVVGSFVGGEIVIKEHVAEFRVEIVFVGYKGVPHNLESISVAIEEIKPAHLILTFEFTYATHGYLLNYTHRELAAFTHEQITRLGGVNDV